MKLTTITPFWNRPDMLERWLTAIAGASHPEVQHLLFVVGEPIPQSFYNVDGLSMVARLVKGPPGYYSIGHYHNMGAELANSEWIMKLDVDTFPHVNFFQQLLDVLDHAGPREWFNVGMVYVHQRYCNKLSKDKLPLTTPAYAELVQSRRAISANSSYPDPQATNWVVRRQEYLDFGGCDPRFRGYGWEDYQQIYMMEHIFRGTDPLPGSLSITNVTKRCRDEIARPRAKLLFERNFQLALIHHWHQNSAGTPYKSHVEANRKVLFDCICKVRDKVKVG